MTELVHAKMGQAEYGDAGHVYQIDFAFGSNLIGPKGAYVGNTKVIHFQMMTGMPLESFIIGLRNFADHLENESFEPSEDGEDTDGAL